jgi:hypothetical protein
MSQKNVTGMPDQNYGKAYRLAERIFRTNSRELRKFYKRLNINFDLYPAFCNRIFWELCLPKVEYGQQVKDRSNIGKEENGISRYQRYTRFNFKVFLHSMLSLFRFVVWVIRAISYSKRGMIFVEGFILDDSRYQLLHDELLSIDQSKIMRIFESDSAPYVYLPWPHWSMLRLLKNKCIENIGAYHCWKIAIRLLKPTRVIISDDSYNKTYSLVLAAKVTDLEVVGLSHGQLPPNQLFAYGFRSYEADNPILFDRFYVWDALFQKAMWQQGNLYDRQVHVCGWLQHLYDAVDYTKSEKRYVLYALEHLTCNRRRVLELLSDLAEYHGYQVIVKTRPQSRNELSGYHPFMTFVDQFLPDHLNHAVCAVGTGSTMIYELSSSGIPLLSPEFDLDYDYNLGLPIPFMSQSISDIERGCYEIFHKTGVSQQFINEFIM